MSWSDLGVGLGRHATRARTVPAGRSAPAGEPARLASLAALATEQAGKYARRTGAAANAGEAVSVAHRRLARSVANGARRGWLIPKDYDSSGLRADRTNVQVSLDFGLVRARALGQRAGRPAPRAGSILAAVHFSQLTAAEQRVLGCLIEKRWTTPDQYPLSLNALRLACNQSTNRDPVTDYDEHAVREAAQRLSHYGLARLASGHSSRAIKYRHLAEDGLGLDREQLAILCVLLLRGPQTPGELKLRSERMAPMGTLADVERILGELAAKGYAARFGRRPGQKEDRFAHLLGGEPEDVPATREPAPAAAPLIPSEAQPTRPAASVDGELEARVAALEADVAALREQLADLLT